MVAKHISAATEITVTACGNCPCYQRDKWGEPNNCGIDDTVDTYHDGLPEKCPLKDSDRLLTTLS